MQWFVCWMRRPGPLALGLGLCCACSAPALAQQPTRPDTLTKQTHLLPTVEVAGSRPSRFAIGTRVLALDSAALSQFRSATVADALAARTPIYFKNYGAGQLASVSIRGTSARHTAVLWNGFNINFSSLGESDFSLFPVNAATTVQLQPGPGSALYGTGAVGGAVLLSGQPRFGGGLRASLQADAGSFGLAAGSAELSYGTERLALRSSGLYRTAQNDFPLPEVYGAGLRQENAAFTQWSFSQDARLRLGQGGQLALAAWLTGADRQIQPSLGAANRHGRETDRSTRLLAEYRQVQGRYEGSVRAAWLLDQLVYGDDTLAPGASDLQTSQAQTEHTLNITPQLSLRLGAEVQHFVATVENGYDGRVSENRYAAFGLLRYDPWPRLRLSANVRQAFVPGQRPPLAPTLGAEWDVLLTDEAAPAALRQRLSLKANAARSYRAPTLNERYWNPGGRPDLLPETGEGYELGLQHELKLADRWQWRSELTAYQQLVDNWVQWLPGRGGIYTPQNLRLVRTRGLEASTALDWQGRGYRAAARASYAYTLAQKQQGYAADPDPVGSQLAYVPEHTATLSTEHTWREYWLLSAASSLSSFRYTSASASEFLPGYFLLQASAGRHFTVAGLRLTLLAQGFNLTNTRYQTYAARAMPPRSAVLSLRLAWR